MIDRLGEGSTPLDSEVGGDGGVGGQSVGAARGSVRILGGWWVVMGASVGRKILLRRCLVSGLGFELEVDFEGFRALGVMCVRWRGGVRVVRALVAAAERHERERLSWVRLSRATLSWARLSWGDGAFVVE